VSLLPSVAGHACFGRQLRQNCAKFAALSRRKIASRSAKTVTVSIFGTGICRTRFTAVQLSFVTMARSSAVPGP
jgi:hypothetical protein